MPDEPAPTPSSSPKPRRARTPGVSGFFLDLFSSVWLGVWLLVAIFLYMSIGSALYPVRQMRFFEMSEFEWFNWWPFPLLIALLCVNLVVATLRRIRLTTRTLGVWMIHSGIIILSLGSVYYFTTKVEGDTPVFRRVVQITSPEHDPVALPALPGASVDVVAHDGVPIRYTVAQTDPRWPLLSGDDKGKEVYSVSVLVRRGEAINRPPFAEASPLEAHPDKASAAQRPFVRQLFAGYPQYTEDVIPGLGRAKNAVGDTILDDALTMSLAHDAQPWFHVVNTWALYTRPLDAHGEPLDEWAQRPIPSAGVGTRGRMPRYNDYLVDPSEVWLAPGENLAPHPLSVPALSRGTNDTGAPDPFAEIDTTITGYLRYAPSESRRIPGDPDRDPLAPYATVRLSGRGLSAVYPLEAFDPAKSSVQDGNLVLRWIDDPEDLAKVGRGTPGKIIVEIPDTNISVTLVLDGTIPVGADAPFRAIPTDNRGGGWGVRVKGLIDDLPISDDLRVSFADVELRTPTGELIHRWVADDPSVTNDLARGDTGQPDSEHRVAPDPRVRTLYAPPLFPPAITLVGSPDQPDQLVALLGVFGGDPVRLPLTKGAGIEVAEGVTLELFDYAAHSRLDTRPRIIPDEQRDRDVGLGFAQARVQINAPGFPRPLALWVPFTQNLLPAPDYSYGGRFPYQPAIIDLPDGRKMELVFSRERRKLPAPVVLDDFILHDHVGGFTGDTSSIRDWESVLRFVKPDGALGDPVSVRTNAPAAFSGFRFFQAMWDPPAGEQSGSPSAGLNFTGLGIGNRNGVYIMLFGGALSVVGSMYAFYLKPVLKRRRAAQVRAQIDAGEFGDEARKRARAADHRAVERVVESNTEALVSSGEIVR